MATIKPRGKSWVLNWSDATGQHRVSLGRIPKQAADVARREKELELKTGRRYRSLSITFTAFVVDYLQWYKVTWPRSYNRANSIIEQQLEPDFGPRDIDTIGTLDVTKFIGRRSQEVAPATVTKEVRCLLAILNRAKEWKYIREHALETYSAPTELSNKSPIYYEPLQLKILYWVDPQHEHVWRLFTNTGMRRNEGLYLKLSDIKPNSIMVESREDSPTKSRKWREVPLNDAAKAAIEHLTATAPKPYLLPRVAPPSLSRAFDMCAMRAGLPGSLHTLRHTFVSHLVMAGVDLPTVQKLAGHASITTTMRYSHLSREHKALAVHKLAL